MGDTGKCYNYDQLKIEKLLCFIMRNAGEEETRAF